MNKSSLDCDFNSRLDFQGEKKGVRKMSLEIVVCYITQKGTLK